MDTLIHEQCSNKAGAKTTQMHCCWLSFEMNWIFSFHIGAFQLYYTFMTTFMQRRLIWYRRPPIKCLLFQSDTAEGRLGILTVASHEHGNVIFSTSETVLVTSVKGLFTINTPLVAHIFHIISDVMYICVVLKYLCWIIGNNFESRSNMCSLTQSVSVTPQLLPMYISKNSYSGLANL